ncbi:hypothetical protein ATANTOWER_025886 [Ataeniobius toweri]|uniref:Uncharacterized protein n=1 Tax=Ataeniobius toweri TaxID=208326 RepID=A0ABU7C4G2_9TELE|nr:hypothetical protein [Ataeniobius toweri]
MSLKTSKLINIISKIDSALGTWGHQSVVSDMVSVLFYKFKHTHQRTELSSHHLLYYCCKEVLPLHIQTSYMLHVFQHLRQQYCGMACCLVHVVSLCLFLFMEEKMLIDDRYISLSQKVLGNRQICSLCIICFNITASVQCVMQTVNLQFCLSSPGCFNSGHRLICIV